GRRDPAADRRPPNAVRGAAVLGRAAARCPRQLLPRPRRPPRGSRASRALGLAQTLLELPRLEQIAVVAARIARVLLDQPHAVVPGGTAPADERLRVVRIVDRHRPV